MSIRLLRVSVRLVRHGFGLLPVALWALALGSFVFGRRQTAVDEAMVPVSGTSAILVEPDQSKSSRQSVRLLRFAPRAFDLITNLVLVGLVVLVMTVLAAPHFVGWRYGILRSGSMSPAMPAGAAIVVAPAGVAGVHVGDVITFRTEVNRDLLVTHRVYAINHTDNGQVSFTTKGDANNTPDVTPVSPERLVGKVIFSVPEVGLIAQKLHSRQGFYLLIALPTLLIILYELRELISGIRDLRQTRRKAEA